MKKLLHILLIFVAIVACNSPKEHTAPAVRERDSVPMMVSYGVNTVISDSGVMKYRIVTERWEVNDKRKPARWLFSRGIFLEQFDEKLHIEAYIQADTAFYLTEQRLWHLVGNVSVKTVDGLKFSSQELYWDQNRHELYSYQYSHLITPMREMEGSYFRSDEQMTRYFVTNSKGSFEQSDFERNETETAATPVDSAVKVVQRPGPQAQRSTTLNGSNYY